MGYWDYNETTGQPFYVEDTPDPSGGGQSNDPNYLYLQGYQPVSQGEGNAYRRSQYGDAGLGTGGQEGPPDRPPILPPDWNDLPTHYADTSRFPSGAGGMPKMSYGQQVQRAIAVTNTPATAVRDEALATNPWWTEAQRQYLSDIPVGWAPEMGGGGTYYPETGKITLHPDNSRGASRVTVMQHELEHALYGNMLSPGEQAQWAGEYANAVLTGRMQPVKERDYFQQYPGDRAIEMYPTRPADLPEEMKRFYSPPPAPVNYWPVPVWRSDPSRKDPARGY